MSPVTLLVAASTAAAAAAFADPVTVRDRTLRTHSFCGGWREGDHSPLVAGCLAGSYCGNRMPARNLPKARRSACSAAAVPPEGSSNTNT